MGIQDNSQLELFSQPGRLGANKGNIRRALSSHFRNYEKAVISIICFLISCVIIFTLGIEKGKNIQLQDYTRLQTMPLPVQQKIKSDPEPKPIQVEPQIKTTPAEPVINTANITLQENTPAKPAIITQQAKDTSAKTLKNKSSVKRAAKERFTIQLASYQNKTIAQKEAQSLKKNGYTPLIIQKGNYSILCVGNFTDKTKAKSTLSKLKKQYHDSMIRRL